MPQPSTPNAPKRLRTSLLARRKGRPLSPVVRHYDYPDLLDDDEDPFALFYPQIDERVVDSPTSTSDRSHVESLVQVEKNDISERLKQSMKVILRHLRKRSIYEHKPKNTMDRAVSPARSTSPSRKTLPLPSPVSHRFSFPLLPLQMAAEEDHIVKRAESYESLALSDASPSPSRKTFVTLDSSKREPDALSIYYEALSSPSTSSFPSSSATSRPSSVEYGANGSDSSREELDLLPPLPPAIVRSLAFDFACPSLTTSPHSAYFPMAAKCDNVHKTHTRSASAPGLQTSALQHRRFQSASAPCRSPCGTALFPINELEDSSSIETSQNSVPSQRPLLMVKDGEREAGRKRRATS